MTLRKKLDKILKTLDQIDERIYITDKKVDKANARIDNLELKVNERLDEFYSYYIQTEETIEKLLERIEFLENFKTSNEKT